MVVVAVLSLKKVWKSKHATLLLLAVKLIMENKGMPGKCNFQVWKKSRDQGSSLGLQ